MIGLIWGYYPDLNAQSLLRDVNKSEVSGVLLACENKNVIAVSYKHLSRAHSLPTCTADIQISHAPGPKLFKLLAKINHHNRNSQPHAYYLLYFLD